MTVIDRDAHVEEGLGNQIFVRCAVAELLAGAPS